MQCACCLWCCMIMLSGWRANRCSLCNIYTMDVHFLFWTHGGMTVCVHLTEPPSAGAQDPYRCTQVYTLWQSKTLLHWVRGYHWQQLSAGFTPVT